jgi:hypothetical protein
MHPIARSALSLLAVTSAALVLLADSADDSQCGPFDVRVQYVTDCFGGDNGTIHVTMPSTGGDPSAKSFTVTVEQGKTVFAVSSVVGAGCSGSSREISDLVFGISAGPSLQAFVCGAWQLGAGTQTVTCSNPDNKADAGDSCTLSFTRSP